MTQNVQQPEEIDSFELTTAQRGERYRYDEGYTAFADIYIVFQDDNKPRELLYNAVTVKEAKEYCNRKDTEGKGWYACWYHCE